MGSKKINRLLAGVIVLALIIGLGYAGYEYENTAPQRTVASFINDIAKNGNDAAAYALTSAQYRSKESYTQFELDYGALNKSSTKYSILGSKIAKNSGAVAGGVVYDLNGVNYNYLMGLDNSNGKWLINSVFVNKQ